LVRQRANPCSGSPTRSGRRTINTSAAVSHVYDDAPRARSTGPAPGVRAAVFAPRTPAESAPAVHRGARGQQRSAYGGPATVGVSSSAMPVIRRPTSAVLALARKCAGHASPSSGHVAAPVVPRRDRNHDGFIDRREAREAIARTATITTAERTSQRRTPPQSDSRFDIGVSSRSCTSGRSATEVATVAFQPATLSRW